MNKAKMLIQGLSRKNRLPRWVAGVLIATMVMTNFMGALPTKGAPTSTINVPSEISGCENSLISVSATATGSLIFLSQNNNTGFMFGAGQVGPSDNPTLVLSGIPSFNKAGTYTINWSTSDGATKTTTVHVCNVDRGPVITAPAVTSTSCGTQVSINALATDPDVGDIITLSASGSPFVAGPNNQSPATESFINNNSTSPSGTVQWIPQIAGTFTITWSAVSNGQTRTITTNISVASNALCNRAPVITPIAPVTIYRDLDLFQLPVTATDPDTGDTVALAYDFAHSDVPGGRFLVNPAVPDVYAPASFNASPSSNSGTLTWRPCYATQANTRLDGRFPLDPFQDCLTTNTNTPGPDLPFSMTFTAVDSRGLAGTPVTVLLTILNKEPRPAFEFHPATPGPGPFCVGKPVSFLLRGSVDPDLRIAFDTPLTTFMPFSRWNFDEGAGDQLVSHPPVTVTNIFNQPGTHTVGLDVQDWNSAWNDPSTHFSQAIEIVDPPRLTITGNGVAQTGDNEYEVTIYRDDQNFSLVATSDDPGSTVHWSENLPMGRYNPAQFNSAPGTGTLFWKPCQATPSGSTDQFMASALRGLPYQDCLTHRTVNPIDRPYQLEFWATNNMCDTKSLAEKTIVHLNVLNQRPIPNITLPISGPYCAGRNIDFGVTGTADPDLLQFLNNPDAPKAVAPVTYWDFGDGDLLQNKIFHFPTPLGEHHQHIFAAPGTYHITMNAEDNNTELNRPADTATKAVVVEGRPEISVSGSGVEMDGIDTNSYTATIYRDEPLHLTVGTDQPAGAVTFSSSGTLPLGQNEIPSSFDSLTGEFSWQPCLATQSGDPTSPFTGPYMNCLTRDPQTNTDRSYTLTFSATSNACNLVSQSITVHVNVINRPPVATADLISPTPLCSQIPVQFTSVKLGRQTSDLDTGPRTPPALTPNSFYVHRWTWDYGDGKIETGDGVGGGAINMAAPFHTYPSTTRPFDNYTVKLHVTDWNDVPNDVPGGSPDDTLNITVQRTSQTIGSPDGSSALTYIWKTGTDKIFNFKSVPISDLDMASPAKLISDDPAVGYPVSGKVPSIISAPVTVINPTKGSVQFAAKELDDLFAFTKKGPSTTYPVTLALKKKNSLGVCAYAFVKYTVTVTKP